MSVCYASALHQYVHDHDPSLAIAYREPDRTIQFVHGTCDDDGFVDDTNVNVYRSTPENNRFVSPQQFVGVDHTNRHHATFPTINYGFKSIDEDFKPIQTETENPPSQHTASTLASRKTPVTTTEWHVMDPSGRQTPILPQQDMTEPDEDTILNRSATLQQQEEAEEGRQSPFGPVPMMESVYFYPASYHELKEMEMMKWDIYQQWFQRLNVLKQRELYWGILQIRENGRVFFQPGKQRQAIIEHKRFVEQSLEHCDPEWIKIRKKEYAEAVAESTQKETQHKQELMLVHLVQTSVFFSLPILANRFLLTHLLGKGGNAEVWNVIDYVNNKRSCALKLSTSHKHAQREHFTHKQLHHPHIVTVDDTAYTIEYQGQLYTAFTIDSGDTDLQQFIEVHGPFDETTALRVFSQLLHAVTYLHHQMHIAHYDIKPTNILVGWDNIIKLTDFDLARPLHEPIQSSVVGTLRYLPPECFRPNFGSCQATAEKADIWMIGIVYCMLVSGQHPIIGEKASAEVARLTLGRYNGRLEYMSNLQVSDVSQRIIQSCLDPDPRRRPTALQLFQSLHG